MIDEVGYDARRRHASRGGLVVVHAHPVVAGNERRPEEEKDETERARAGIYKKAQRTGQEAAPPRQGRQSGNVMPGSDWEFSPSAGLDSCEELTFPPRAEAGTGERVPAAKGRLRVRCCGMERSGIN